MRVPGAARLAEAREGIGHLRDELAYWVGAVEAHGPPGAHRSRLTTLRSILDDTLDVLGAHAVADTTVAAAYAAARTLDRRVLFCRRLFRWYALRFDQRRDPAARACLDAADEVVWSVWAQAFDAAGADRPPAPLCFVDNDPVPWASLHHVLPHDTRPPSGDAFLTDRINALPIPVIGLPPLVIRRPWWLVSAVHEAGHHVQHRLGVVDSVGQALASAVQADGGSDAEARQWSDWGGEIFADAFAAAFTGAAWVWAVGELERADPAVLVTARATYPPPVVRWELVRALVAATGAHEPAGTLADPAAPFDPAAVATLYRRIPAVTDAVLDHPLGATTLRTLAGDGRARMQAHARWTDELVAGEAVGVAELGAAEACLAGGVRAWQTGGVVDPGVLQARLLAVLPLCRPDGTRAAEDGRARAATDALIAAVLDPGAEL